MAIADDPFTTNPINPEKIIIQAKLHGTSDSFEDFFQRVDAFIRSNPDIISSTNSTPPSSSSASRFTPFILLRCADSVLYTATKLSEFSEDKRSAMLLSNNSEGDKVTIIQDGDDTTSITRGSSNSSVSVDNLLLLTWSSIHFAQQQTPPSFTFLSALDLFRSLLSTYDTTTHDVALPSSPPTNPNIIITSTDILIQFEKTLPHCKILECHVPDLAQLFNHPSSTNMSLMAQNLQIAFTREESWMNSCLEEVYAMEGWIDECFAKDDS